LIQNKFTPEIDQQGYLRGFFAEKDILRKNIASLFIIFVDDIQFIHYDSKN
jgi:hypothetical protein